ncbi:hypothetical protein [Brevibacillus formosus]|uniref:hypothetical protein n=1 Tax=Brevibacillus formosus TaxID=54913 RepID=UPI003F1A9B6F
MSKTLYENLISSLPTYHRDGPQYQAIMKAVADLTPDVDGEWWKVFFLHLQSEISREMWKKELDVQDEEELVAKLRSLGTLSVEMITEQGFGIQESYRLMPEAGVELSEFGVLADRWEFAPLTSVIFTTPETLGVARGLVKIMGLAGFRYLFSIALSHKIEYERGSASQSMDRYGAILTTDHRDDELSGKEKMTKHSRTQYSFQSIKHDRMSWWSPNVFFTDDVTFADEVFYIQQSKVTKTI